MSNLSEIFRIKSELAGEVQVSINDAIVEGIAIDEIFEILAEVASEADEKGCFVLKVVDCVAVAA